MNLDSVTGVLQRISDIEKRIGMQPEMPHQNQFGTELEKAMKAQQVRQGEEAGFQHSSSGTGGRDIDNMIRTAADKYNVDPSLLSAIAETESNYNQSAVSSAGAVLAALGFILPLTLAGKWVRAVRLLPMIVLCALSVARVAMREPERQRRPHDQRPLPSERGPRPLPRHADTPEKRQRVKRRYRRAS